MIAIIPTIGKKWLSALGVIQVLPAFASDLSELALNFLAIPHNALWRMLRNIDTLNLITVTPVDLLNITANFELLAAFTEFELETDARKRREELVSDAKNQSRVIVASAEERVVIIFSDKSSLNHDHQHSELELEQSPFFPSSPAHLQRRLKNTKLIASTPTEHRSPLFSAYTPHYSISQDSSITLSLPTTDTQSNAHPNLTNSPCLI